MTGCRGKIERLVHDGPSLAKVAEYGQGSRQEATERDGLHGRHVESFPGKPADENLRPPPEDLNRATVVAEIHVGVAQATLHPDLNVHIAEWLGDRERAVPKLHRALGLALPPPAVRHL